MGKDLIPWRRPAWWPDYRHGTAVQHNMSTCTAPMPVGAGRCEMCGWTETGDESE
jgi:hypothetical protein